MNDEWSVTNEGATNMIQQMWGTFLVNALINSTAYQRESKRGSILMYFIVFKISYLAAVKCLKIFYSSILIISDQTDQQNLLDSDALRLSSSFPLTYQ